MLKTASGSRLPTLKARGRNYSTRPTDGAFSRNWLTLHERIQLRSLALPASQSAFCGFGAQLIMLYTSRNSGTHFFFHSS